MTEPSLSTLIAKRHHSLSETLAGLNGPFLTQIEFSYLELAVSIMKYGNTKGHFPEDNWIFRQLPDTLDIQSRKKHIETLLQSKLPEMGKLSLINPFDFKVLQLGLLWVHERLSSFPTNRI